MRAWLATAAARGAAVPAYDLAGVRPSVVHIGPGVFHRAHQAVYCDGVLATGSPTGGICAVSLRSADLHHATWPARDTCTRCSSATTAATGRD